MNGMAIGVVALESTLDDAKKKAAWAAFQAFRGRQPALFPTQRTRNNTDTIARAAWWPVLRSPLHPLFNRHSEPNQTGQCRQDGGDLVPEAGGFR